MLEGFNLFVTSRKEWRTCLSSEVCQVATKPYSLSDLLSDLLLAGREAKEIQDPFQWQCSPAPSLGAFFLLLLDRSISQSVEQILLAVSDVVA